MNILEGNILAPFDALGGGHSSKPWVVAGRRKKEPWGVFWGCPQGHSYLGMTRRILRRILASPVSCLPRWCTNSIFIFSRWARPPKDWAFKDQNRGFELYIGRAGYWRNSSDNFQIFDIRFPSNLGGKDGGSFNNPRVYTFMICRDLELLPCKIQRPRWGLAQTQLCKWLWSGLLVQFLSLEVAIQSHSFDSVSPVHIGCCIWISHYLDMSEQFWAITNSYLYTIFLGTWERLPDQQTLLLSPATSTPTSPHLCTHHQFQLKICASKALTGPRLFASCFGYILWFSMVYLASARSLENRRGSVPVFCASNKS